MEIAYWIIAALLALFYGYSGGKKVAQGKDALRPMMRWVDQVPMPFVRIIGALEILGGLGLIVPPLTGVAPGLAIVAAIGLALVQVGAITLHLMRGEARQIGMNIALLGLTGVTIWLSTIWVG